VHTSGSTYAGHRVNVVNNVLNVKGSIGLNVVNNLLNVKGSIGLNVVNNVMNVGGSIGLNVVNNGCNKDRGLGRDSYAHCGRCLAQGITACNAQILTAR